MFVLIFLTAVQQGIIVAMFLQWGVKVEHKVDETSMTDQVACNTFSINITQKIYTSLIILACMVQAVRARKLPQNYNETKFIAFAMFSALIIQLISMPLMISSETEVRSVLIECIMMFLSNLLLLLILFGYKVVIILFQSEKNTTEVFRKQNCEWQQKNVARNLRRRQQKILRSSTKLQSTRGKLQSTRT